MRPPTSAIGWCHWASRAAVEQQLPAREAHVLLTMALFSNGDGCGHATRPTLALRCVCSRATVARALAGLRERGLWLRVGNPRGPLQWRLNAARAPLSQLALPTDRVSHPGETPEAGDGWLTQAIREVAHPGETQSVETPVNGSPLPPQPPAGGNGHRPATRKNGKPSPRSRAANPRAMAAAAAQDQAAAAAAALARGQPLPPMLDAYLHEHVPDDLYAIWLAGVRVVATDGDVLTIDAPPETRTWVRDRFARVLTHAAAAAGVRLQWPDPQPKGDTAMRFTRRHVRQSQ